MDIFGKNDWVAAWRTASLTTKEGKQAPSLVLVDVWHVKEGKVRGVPASHCLCHALQCSAVGA